MIKINDEKHQVFHIYDKKEDRKIWYKIWYRYLKISKHDKEKYDKKFVGKEIW